MAISDEFWLIGLAYAFTYLILYKKYKLGGNIIFIVISAGILLTATNDTERLVGIATTFVSISSTVLDFFRKKHEQ